MNDPMMAMLMPFVMDQLRSPEAQAAIANLILQSFQDAGVSGIELDEPNYATFTGSARLDDEPEGGTLDPADGILHILQTAMARFSVPVLITVWLEWDAGARVHRASFVPREG